MFIYIFKCISPVIYIYSIYIKRRAHTECDILHELCMSSSTWMGPICITQQSDGRISPKSSGIHSPILTMPHSAHFLSVLGVWSCADCRGGKEQVCWVQHVASLSQHGSDPGMLGSVEEAPMGTGTSGTSLLQVDGANATGVPHRMPGMSACPPFL